MLAGMHLHSCRGYCPTALAPVKYSLVFLRHVCSLACRCLVVKFAHILTHYHDQMSVLDWWQGMLHALSPLRSLQGSWGL